MKKLIATLLTIFMIGSLAACGASATESSDSAAQTTGTEARVLRMGHHLTDEDGNNKMALKFAELVEEKTAGSLKIEIYTNGQLGGQSECLEALKAGSLDMSISDTGLLANYEPSIGILDMPYVFDSLEHARAVMDGEIGTELKEKVAAASGIRPITLEGVLFRNVFLKDKAVTTPADLAGVKIRVPESTSITSTFQALGASPVAIPSGEAYTSIQTGLVDGLEGNAEFLTLNKYYEICNTWSETNHILTCTAMNMSEKVWESLTADQQTAITESAAEALDYFYGLYNDISAQGYQTLRDNNVQIVEVDKAAMQAAVQPVVDQFLAKNNMQDVYTKIQELKD